MGRIVGTLIFGFLFFSVALSVHAAWVSPTGSSDPSSQWTNESNAYDDNDGTYASNNPGGGGFPNKWGGFIVLTFPAAIDTDRLQVKADFGPPGVDRVDIDVWNGAWNDVYEGSINNASWDEISFTQVNNVTQARFRFRYDAHFIYWLFEFDLWEVVPITLPSATTQSPTSVEETSAILHGQVTDDGGEPCDYRFQYGTTDSYGTNTAWQVGAVSTGDSFGQVITGLTQGQTYHYRVQVRNSAGVSSGSDQEFFTGAPASGWVTPTGNSDPNGEWNNETNAHDDELTSYADSYHNIGDPDGRWSFYIHFTHPSITSNQLRFYAKNTDMDRVDVDVYDGGSWTDVYEGNFNDMAWDAQAFAQQSVQEARIRFRVDNNNKGVYWELYEFDFWRVSTSAPTLAWTGETNYTTDGLDPEVGCDSTPFEFRVLYTDADNNAPSTIQLNLDADGDGTTYETVLDMSLASDAAPAQRDGDYTNGEIFTVTTTIPYGPTTNNCSYFFSANDGTFAAVGAPTTPINAPNVLRGIGVFIGDDNPGSSNETQSSTGVEMIQIKLIADAVEDVIVQDLRLDPTGLGHDRNDIPATPAIQIYRDENNNGTYDSGTDTFIYSQRYTANDTNTVFNIPDQTITAGTTENWLVVYDFSPTVTDVGDTFLVTALPAQVNCQGAVSMTSFSGYGENVASGTKTITAGTGSLTVSAGPSNPGDSSASNNATDLTMLQLSLSASAVEDINISSITFTASGTIDDSADITDAELWLDVDDNGEFNNLIDTQIDGAQTYAADNGTVTFGGLTETITAGSTENWLVVYDLAGTAFNGDTARVTLSANGDITAVGAVSANPITPTGAPVQGKLLTISPVGSLTIEIGDDSPPDTNEANNGTNIEMLQLKITASATEDIDVTAITFNASGTMTDNVDISGVRLYNDVNNNGTYESGVDTQIDGGAQTYAADDGTVTFGGLTETILASDTENWLVLYNLGGSAANGETCKVNFSNNADITTQGQTSLQAALVSGAPAGGATKTISNVGSLTLNIGDSNPGASNEPNSATGVEMLQLKLIASSVEDIVIEDLQLIPTGTGHDRNDIPATPAVQIYRDENDNGVYDSGTDTYLYNARYAANDTPTTFDIPDQTITKGTTENWLIVYDFSPTVTDVGDTFETKVNPTGITAQGATSASSITPTGTSAVGNTKTIVAAGSTGALSISVGSNNPADSNVSASAVDREIFQLALTASAVEDVDISSIIFTASGSAHDVTDITDVELWLDVDDDGNFNPLIDTQINGAQTYAADNNQVTFGGLTETITAGATENWLVVYDLAGSASLTETFTTQVAANAHVTATGAVSANPITPTGAPVNGATLTVSNVGMLTFAVGDDSPGNSSEANDASNLEMLQIKLTASSAEDVDVTSITFTASGTAADNIDITDVRVYLDVNDNGTYESAVDTRIDGAAQSYAADDGTVTFGGLTETVSAGASENWLILYNLAGSASNGETLKVNFSNDTDVTATGVSSAQPVGVIGDPVGGATKTISNIGSLTISAGANNPGASNEPNSATGVEMLQIEFTASSVEDIIIEQIQLIPTGTGHDRNDIPATPAVQIYIDENDNGVYDSGTDTYLYNARYSANDTPTTFDIPDQTITKGTTENWLIIYDFSPTVTDVGDTFEAKVNPSGVTAIGATSASSITPGGSAAVGNTKTIVAAGSTGTLTVAAGANNPFDRNTTASAQDEEVLQLSLTASSIEDVDISSIQFISSGSAHDVTDITDVELWLDVNGNGALDVAIDTQINGAQTYASDDGQVVFGGLTETITASDTENWLVVYDLAGSASNTETFTLQFASNNHITAVGGTSANPITPSGAPVNGATLTVSNVGTITVAIGDDSPADSSEANDATNLEMIQLKISASATENVNITSITFTASGTAADNTDITSAKLYNDVNNSGEYELAFDSQIDGAQTYAADDGTVTFAGLTETINASSTENWLIVYDLAGTASDGETFKVNFSNDTDMTATGVTSGQPVGVIGDPVGGATKTISSIGSLTISAGDNNPGASNEPNTATGVETLQIKFIASSVEDIVIESLQLIPTGTGHDRNDLPATTAVEIYRDENDNGIYDAGTDTYLFDDRYSANDTPTTFDFPDQTITKGTTENWLIVYNFSPTVTDVGDTFETKINPSGVTATGATSSSSITASGSAAVGNTKTIVAAGSTGTLTVAAGANNPTDTNVQATTVDVEILQISLTASAVEDVDISSITFVGSGTAHEVNDLTDVELWIDNDDNGIFNNLIDTQIDGAQTYGSDDGQVTFAGLTETITAGSTENWLVVYDLNGNATNGETITIQFANNAHITAVGGTSANPITPSGAPVDGATITVTDVGLLTVDVGTNSPGALDVPNDASDLVMLQFEITANATENVDISSISFDGSGTAVENTDITNVRLYLDVNDNGSYDAGTDTQIDGGAETYGADNGTVTFAGLTETINASSTENWLVIYNLAGTGSNGETIKITFSDNADITATGQTSALPAGVTGAPAVGATKTLADVGSINLSQGLDNPPATNELTSATDVEVLQFRLTANATENVNVNSIQLIPSGVGNDNADLPNPSVYIYIDVNENGIYEAATDTLIVSGQYTGDDTATVFNTVGQVVNAGTTEVWLVAYDFNAGVTDVGDTFTTRIQTAGVTAVGATSGLPVSITGAQVNGGLKTIVAAGSTGSLTLNTGANNPPVATVGANDNGVEMLQVALSASSVENVDISSITFTASGTADENADITRVQLYNDTNNNGVLDGDPQINGDKTYSVDNGTVIFNGLTETINASSTEHWLVVYDLAGTGSTGETIITDLAVNAHVVATGATSANPITPSGAPINGNTVTLTGNNAPTLDWTGEANYVADGLNLEVGYATTNFIYRIEYTDADDDPPTVMRVYIDRNGDGDYGDASEVVDMNEDNPGDTDYTDGKIYTYTTTIPYGPDTDNCSYYFEANDGEGAATGAPTTPINAPDVLQTLSVSVSSATYDFGIVDPGSYTTTASSITVTNDGDGDEDFKLQITTSPADYTVVETAANPGADQYKLLAMFNSVAPGDTFDGDAPAEGTSDIIFESGQKDCDTTNFAGDQNGDDVPATGTRELWIRFGAPSSTSTGAQQTIVITIEAFASSEF